jgi:hypothetical protein
VAREIPGSDHFDLVPPPAFATSDFAGDGNLSATAT